MKLKRFTPIIHAIVPYLASWYSYFMGCTTRLTQISPPGFETKKKIFKQIIYCTWHSRFFYFSYFGRGTKTYTMISVSRDGELITRVIKKMRLPAIRGSSTRRGKEALEEMAKAVSDGATAFMIPDGPNGPRHQFKPGAIRLAQLTGAPIAPVAFSSTRGLFFPTWDRFFVPLPFGKAVLLIGEPLLVPPDLTAEEFERLRGEMEQEMERLCSEADRLCGRDPERELMGRKRWQS